MSVQDAKPLIFRDTFETGVSVAEWKSGAAGYKESNAYPSGFNAADFPLDGSDIRITGNNMAYFFASPLKDASNQIVDIKPDEKAFKRLIENIVKSGTPEKRSMVRMQIDADVLENPSRFVDKYWEMRSEDGEAKRRELLGKEVQIIQDFIRSGGVKRLVKDALQQDAVARTGSVLPNNAIEALADRFLTENFRLEGVKTEEPLKFATWEVEGWQGTNDTLLARQEYDKDTLMTQRRWKLGRKSVIDQLANVQAASRTIEKGAAEVSDAVTFTQQLETIDLNQTRGSSGQGLGGSQTR